MKQKVHGAVIHSLLGNYGSIVSGLITTIIASRMLDHQSVGAYASSISLITVLTTLLDFNIVSYATRAEDLSPEDLGGLFGLSLLLYIPSCAFIILYIDTMAVWLGGGPLAIVLRIMIPSLLINPLLLPAQASLRRNMHFGVTSTSIGGGAIFRMILSVIFLFFGWGVVALAWAYTLSRFVELAILFLANAPSKFVIPNRSGWRRAMSFSSVATAAQLVGTIGFSSAELLIGHRLSIADVGIYNRGSALTNIYRTGIERGIIPVVYSKFSHSLRNGENVVNLYLEYLSMLTVFGWPMLTVLAIMSEKIVVIMFGDSWLRAVPVTQILSLASAIYIVASLGPSLLTATGNVSSFLRREILIQIPRVLVIFYCASLSIVYVAWGVLFTYIVSTAIDQFSLRSAASINIRSVLITCRKSLVVTIFVGSSAELSQDLFDSYHYGKWEVLLLVIMISILSWISSVRIVKHPVWYIVRDYIVSFGLSVCGRRIK